MKIIIAAVAIGLAGSISGSALATPSLTYVGADLAAGASSFTLDNSTFTFSSTGDIFNPLAVSTSDGAEISSFGGFLSIPVVPSSSFTDRGVVTYGPGAYSAFPSTSTVPYSNGANFLGLLANYAGNNYYGFAYTVDSTLVGYGFESAANTPITATTAISPAPEPSTWALALAGVAMIGAALRFGRRRSIATLMPVRP